MCDSEYAVGMASKSMKLSKKSHQDLYIALGESRAMLDNVNIIFQYMDNVWVKSVLGH